MHKLPYTEQDLHLANTAPCATHVDSSHNPDQHIKFVEATLPLPVQRTEATY